MGWCTTFDLDRFVAAAGGYLRSTAVENTLLLSAAQAARSGWDPRIAGRPPGTARPQRTGAASDPRTPSDPHASSDLRTASATSTAPPGPGVLFGWWEPPDGSEPRGAFLHDPAAPLLIAGRAPEMAAALAGTLAKMGRLVTGVDGPVEAADAFAAAWSNRAGATIRMHKQCRVYRLVAGGAGGTGTGAAGETQATGGNQAAFPAEPAFLSDPPWPGALGGRGAGSPGAGRAAAGLAGPAGRLRVATRADRALVADWLTAYATEAAERIGSAQELADDLIGYGGALLWESPQRTSRIREAAQHLVGAHHRDPGHGAMGQRDAAAQNADPGYQPVAMVALTRPVAGTVRISITYTVPDRRRNGYAAAAIFAASRAVIEGVAPYPQPGSDPRAGSQVVMITDTNRPERRVARLGYQLVDKRTVLRFGPPTSPLQSLRSTGPMPRLPTGPLPRFKR